MLLIPLLFQIILMKALKLFWPVSFKFKLHESSKSMFGNDVNFNKGEVFITLVQENFQLSIFENISDT